MTSARPGVWYSHTEGTWVRHGEPLFPEAAPTVLEQIAPGQSRLTPSQYTAAGIASIGDSLVLQGFSWFAKPFDWNAPPARNETRNGLIVFSRTGDHLATIELPSGVSAALLSTEVTSGRVFLNAVDPFPQVVEYRLAECTAPRARTLQPSQEPSA